MATNATKPELPPKIETIAQGKAFLMALSSAKWKFPPDADALTEKFSGCSPENLPIIVERRRLNKLMEQCLELAAENIFDPYAWFYFDNTESPISKK